MTRRLLLSTLMYFAVFAALISGGLAYVLRRSESAMLSWPRAQGAMMASSVERKAIRSESPRASNAVGEYWVVSVRYTYEIAGRTLEGTQLSNRAPRVRTWRSKQAPASLVALLARYPAGASISVRHHPLHPERSVLEVDTSGSRRVALVAGVFVAVAVGASLLLRTMSRGP